jgi:Protein of unknown function (DUF2806)
MSDGESNPLVNLGDLTKPADTLIKKVSKAVGGYFAPWQIKRVARAEAEAAIIQAQAEIEITDLHRRAVSRFFQEEVRNQTNIEDITMKALPQLKAESDPSVMDDDWVTNFFDKSRIVSDGEMQDLWSRVLAGEANTPGTYSKRTVNFLSDLDKSDAEVFSKLCGFVWMLGTLVPLIFDAKADTYNSQGINFAALIHLQSIGLIQFNSVTGFKLFGLGKHVGVSYYGKPLLLEMPTDADNDLAIGKVLFTKIGQELAPICGSTPVEGFWDYVNEHWKQFLPTTNPTAASPSPSVSSPRPPPS